MELTIDQLRRDYDAKVAEFDEVRRAAARSSSPREHDELIKEAHGLLGEAIRMQRELKERVAAAQLLYVVKIGDVVQFIGVVASPVKLLMGDNIVVDGHLYFVESVDHDNLTITVVAHGTVINAQWVNDREEV